MPTTNEEIKNAVLPVYEQRINDCQQMIDCNIEGIQMTVAATDHTGNGVIKNFFFSRSSGLPPEFKEFLKLYANRLRTEKFQIETEL